MKMEKFENIIVSIILTLLLIANIFTYGIFSYVDEFVGVFSLLILVVILLKSKLKRSIAQLLSILMFLLFIGFLSNMLSGIPIPFLYILFDALILSQPFLIFFAVSQLANKATYFYIKKKYNKIAKLFIFIAFIFFILNTFNVVRLTTNYRWGIPEFRFIFGFPASFGFFIFTLLGIITDYEDCIYKQTFVLITMVLMLSTLKFQALFQLFLFLGLLFFWHVRGEMTFNIKKLQIPVLISGLVVWPAITNYFFTTDFSPRRVLLTDSLQLMRDHFPLGAGFSTFGSPIAARIYSPIYAKLSYYNLHGLWPEGDFLNDNFVASIIGQYGIIGMVTFTSLALLVLKRIIVYQKKSRSLVFSLSAYISLLAAMVGSSFFTGPPGALAMAVIAINNVTENLND